MGGSKAKWPAVGRKDANLARHASNIIVEYRDVIKYALPSIKGVLGKPIPFTTFSALAESTLDFVQKATEQPGGHVLLEAIKRIEQAVNTVKDDSRATRYHAEDTSQDNIGTASARSYAEALRGMPAPPPHTVLSRASGSSSAAPINSTAAREVKVSNGSNIV